MPNYAAIRARPVRIAATRVSAQANGFLRRFVADAALGKRLASAVLNAGTMKRISTRLIGAIVVGLLGTALGYAAPQRFLRYETDAPFTRTGTDDDAAGKVQAFVKEQGRSNHRRLRIRVSNLDANAAYSVQAWIGESDLPVTVTTFSTDGSGKANLVYVENNSMIAAPAARTPRRNKHALPENVFDVASVRALAIVNSNDQVVLTADLHAPEVLNYQVATALANTGNDPDAIGVMAAAVQSGTLQFRLFAMGQSSQYTLVINEQPVASYTADLTGGIAVGTYPAAAPLPMQFRAVSLKNSADVVILESNVQ